MDDIVFFVSDIIRAFRQYVGQRELWEWCFLLFPFFLFAELPRYILPAFVLGFLKFIGRLPNDEFQKAQFMDRHPSISVLLVGYNEEESIDKAIDSLLELEYEGLEIIVVDDGSHDSMYARAKPYADKGLIKLWRNTAATGRGGRPSASNMAFHLSSGDFILSLDADTSFDRSLLLHMIGPFYDESIGAVAGNIKVRNFDVNKWTVAQAMEYMMSIGLWRRWLDLFRMNLFASGALGAFRRTAIERVGGWDPELAEDADLCLKIKKSGWSLAFAPLGVGMTAVPTALPQLVNQRLRWDKGMIRTFFRKHKDLLNYRLFNFRNTLELGTEFIFTVVFGYAYFSYLLIMLFYDPLILVTVMTVTILVYTLTFIATLCVAVSLSERRKEEWRFLMWVPWMLVYKEIFRWVRLYGMTLELLRINYEDNFLPQSAWRNTRKW